MPCVLCCAASAGLGLFYQKGGGARELLREAREAFLTSKNPFMKLSGSRSAPRKFSVLKYAMTCVVCFQKFIISYIFHPIPWARVGIVS